MEPRHGSPRRSALRALPCTELGADRCAYRGSMTRSGPSPVPPPPSTPTPRPCPHIDGSSAAAKVTSGATRRPGAVGESGRRCGGGPAVPHHLSPWEGKGRRLSVFEHGHAASLELRSPQHRLRVWPRIVGEIDPRSPAGSCVRRARFPVRLAHPQTMALGPPRAGGSSVTRSRSCTSWPNEAARRR